MKIIYNSIIPFHGFKCINLFELLFTRKECFPLKEWDINHELIHSAQMREMLYIFFYVAYLLEWGFRLLFTKDRFSIKAYRNISFEKEAYDKEFDLDYLKQRKHFAQWR